MKENLKFWILAAALLFFACYPTSSQSATLSGPQRAEAGRLATVKSDVKGDWLIYPPDGADLAKDSDEQTLYFVARRDCELTVIFFGVEAGKPVITQTAIQIGPAPAPEPSPTPSPAPVVTLTDREKAAAHAALSAVIDGVEAGTIQTPQGARSTFKQTLTAKGQACNGRTCYLPDSLSRLADDWTARTDFTTAQTVKASFEGFLKEVE